MWELSERDMYRIYSSFTCFFSFISLFNSSDYRKKKELHMISWTTGLNCIWCPYTDVKNRTINMQYNPVHIHQ